MIISTSRELRMNFTWPLTCSSETIETRLKEIIFI